MARIYRSLSHLVTTPDRSHYLRSRCDQAQYAQCRDFGVEREGYSASCSSPPIVGVAVLWPAISAISDGLMEQRELCMAAKRAELERLEAENAHWKGDAPLSGQTPSSFANCKGSGLYRLAHDRPTGTSPFSLLAALCQTWFNWKRWRGYFGSRQPVYFREPFT